MNNVQVKIEKEKEYDKVVEEVVERLAKNNLHKKLEIYK